MANQFQTSANGFQSKAPPPGFEKEANKPTPVQSPATPKFQTPTPRVGTSGGGGNTNPSQRMSIVQPANSMQSIAPRQPTSYQSPAYPMYQTPASTTNQLYTPIREGQYIEYVSAKAKSAPGPGYDVAATVAGNINAKMGGTGGQANVLVTANPAGGYILQANPRLANKTDVNVEIAKELKAAKGVGFYEKDGKFYVAGPTPTQQAQAQKYQTKMLPGQNVERQSKALTTTEPKIATELQSKTIAAEKSGTFNLGEYLFNFNLGESLTQTLAGTPLNEGRARSDVLRSAIYATDVAFETAKTAAVIPAFIEAESKATRFTFMEGLAALTGEKGFRPTAEQRETAQREFAPAVKYSVGVPFLVGFATEAVLSSAVLEPATLIGRESYKRVGAFQINVPGATVSEGLGGATPSEAATLFTERAKGQEAGRFVVSNILA